MHSRIAEAQQKPTQSKPRHAFLRNIESNSIKEEGATHIAELLNHNKTLSSLNLSTSPQSNRQCWYRNERGNSVGQDFEDERRDKFVVAA